MWSRTSRNLAAIASGGPVVIGCMPLGSLPALYASYLSGAIERSKDSAIWLRAEFPVHRNTTFNFGFIAPVCVRLIGRSVIALRRLDGLQVRG